MSERSRPIKTKIVSLLLVPLVSLIALWAFAAGTTFSDVRALLNGRTLGNFAFSGEELVVALQDERKVSLMYVGADRPDGRAQMDALRARTDEAAAVFRREAGDEGIQAVTNAATKRWVAEALRQLDALASVRDSIDAGRARVVPTLEAYAEMIMPLARLPGAMAANLGHPQIATEANTLGAMLVAREILYREYSLLSGALEDGRLTKPEYAKFVQLVGTSRYVYAQVFPDMRPEDQQRYENITASPAASRVRTMEDQVISHGIGGAPAPVDAATWRTSSNMVMDELIAMGKASGQGTIDRTLPAALRIILRFALAGLVGLIAVIMSIVLSVRIGRSIVHDLTGLREAARDLADERLPRVVERLHRGGPDEDVEEDAAARLPSFGTREIAEVGVAFSAVQRTAVKEAVNEARMRAGIRQVFVSLARRSQTLLSRQLKMLDSMERRTEDPDSLDDLFRLDHLATRMQRHAEGLIILSGSTPGRRWRDPVPMMDVLRAAVAEVEGYARVEVLPVAPHQVSLAGPVIADVVHLLAELIENATLYSPPNTEVRVYPQVVSNGFVVEIEDRGLGMSAEDLASANERLANPPEFEPSEMAQLGLFVVAQLAQRHGISVSMRSSPYGGATAIVLLPPALIADEDGSAAGRTPLKDSAPRREEGTDDPAPARPGPEPETRPSEPAGGSSPRRESEPAGVATGSVAVEGQPALPRRVRQASLRPDARKDGETR